jgi:PAS domain S-box-containing protein
MVEVGHERRARRWRAPRFVDLPLGRQFQLAVGLGLVVVLAQSMFAIWTALSNQRLAEQVAQSNHVIALSHEALNGLVDMETGYRGFLLTGDEVFLEPYIAGQYTYEARLTELERETAENPSQVARWQDLEQRAADWQHEVTQPGIALRRAVASGDETLEAVAAYVKSQNGKQHFDAMRQEFADAVNSEQLLQAQRNSEASAANARLVPVLVGVLLMAVVLGLVGATTFARSIVQAADRLASTSQQLARGDLDQRIGLDRGDELGTTARAFDLMAARLQAIIHQNESILAAAGEGIIGLDRQDRVMFANAAAEAMLGYGPEELRGRSLHHVAHHSRPDGTPYPPETCPLHAVRDSGEVVRVSDEVFWRKDGTAFPVEYVGTPLREPGGLAGAVVVFQDITERKQTEQELRRTSAELARQQAELERSNGELQQFASVASHDLQEPLRKVQAFGDRLVRKHGSELSEEGRDYLARMQNAAARMQVLINDLLTFSRVSARTQPFRPVNIADIVDDVIADLEVRLEKSKGAVDVGWLPTIEADPLQMRQLFQNLLANALKFRRPEETPRVRVSALRVSAPERPPAANSATRISAEEEVTWYQFAVEDNGVGFDEKYLDRMFTIFQRLHGRSEYEGTGVGLAVCRKIVDRHGGTITARSSPGHGATFLVTLPASQGSGPDPA